jgi:hypothetical protein
MEEGEEKKRKKNHHQQKSPCGTKVSPELYHLDGLCCGPQLLGAIKG